MFTIRLRWIFYYKNLCSITVRVCYSFFRPLFWYIFYIQLKNTLFFIYPLHINIYKDTYLCTSFIYTLFSDIYTFVLYVNNIYIQIHPHIYNTYTYNTYYICVGVFMCIYYICNIYGCVYMYKYTYTLYSLTISLLIFP